MEMYACIYYHFIKTRPEDSWDSRGIHSTRPKQRRKGLKSKGKVGNLVLGEEIGMNKVV
jgi:hypothetical protein